MYVLAKWAFPIYRKEEFKMYLFVFNTSTALFSNNSLSNTMWYCLFTFSVKWLQSLHILSISSWYQYHGWIDGWIDSLIVRQNRSNELFFKISTSKSSKTMLKYERSLSLSHFLHVLTNLIFEMDGKEQRVWPTQSKSPHYSYSIIAPRSY